MYTRRLLIRLLLPGSKYGKTTLEQHSFEHYLYCYPADIEQVPALITQNHVREISYSLKLK